MGFDFGVGYSELFVLAILALLVIGPKDLPKVLRTFGQFMRKARSMAREFQGHVDAAMRDAGVDDLKKDIADIKGTMSPPTNMATMPSASGGYGVTSASREFDRFFGEGSKGQTRVLGALVSDSQPKP